MGNRDDEYDYLFKGELIDSEQNQLVFVKFGGRTLIKIEC